MLPNAYPCPAVAILFQPHNLQAIIIHRRRAEQRRRRPQRMKYDNECFPPRYRCHEPYCAQVPLHGWSPGLATLDQECLLQIKPVQLVARPTDEPPEVCVMNVMRIYGRKDESMRMNECDRARRRCTPKYKYKTWV